MPQLDLPAWHHRHTLPPEVLEVLGRPPGSFVAIVSTTDDDGAPRTAAFGVMRATSPSGLRFGCRRSHATFANLERDGRVMIALLAAPDVAVGIRGQARVIDQALDAMASNALVEVEVERVKNDTVPQLPITRSLGYATSDEMAAHLDEVNEELGR